jgi:hypothetical protein
VDAGCEFLGGRMREKPLFLTNICFEVSLHVLLELLLLHTLHLHSHVCFYFVGTLMTSS